MSEAGRSRRPAQGSQAAWQQVEVLGRLLAGRMPEPGLGWEEMAMLARRQRVSPLLFWQMRVQKDGQTAGEGGGPDEIGIPTGTWQDLAEDFYLTAAQGMRSERELAQILHTLEGEGVPAVVIKGAALAAEYPDPALRPYGDLDLLVPEARLAQAERVLNGLGYRGFTSKGWSVEHHRHLPTMLGEDGRIPVEIHWRLDNPGQTGQLPTQEMWARAWAWSVGGQAALRLDPVDAALHVCCHAVVQNVGRLGLLPVCDLVQLAGHWDRAQWDALVRRGRRYGLERAVFFMLSLARQAMELAVPGDVWYDLEPAGGEVDQIERFLTLAPRRETLPVTAIRALAQEGLPVRVIYLMRSVFPSRASMAALYKVPADSARIWATYARRPLDLLRRHGKAAWQVVRGDEAMQEVWEREAWLAKWLRQEDK